MSCILCNSLSVQLQNNYAIVHNIYITLIVPVIMKSFEIKTKENKININYFLKFILKENIKLDKNGFAEMCKEGCKNYNKKYSCPPFVPDFDNLLKNYDGLYLVLFLSRLDSISSTEYNKVRIANSVMKSRLIKLMRHLEKMFNTTFLSMGSCNLCKLCKCKLNLPCEHPKERRYSLEATGVDCNELSKKLFKIPLSWYKKKKAPEYTCVMCGLLCNKENTGEIEKEIINYRFA